MLQKWLRCHKIIFCNNKEFYTGYRNQETKWLKGIHAVNILWDSSGGEPLETRQTGRMPKKYLTTSQHIHYTFELFSFLTLKMLVYVGGHVTWDASYRLWCALRRKASHFLQTCRQTQSIWTLIHSSGCSGAGSLRDHLICSYSEKHLRELCEGKSTFFNCINLMNLIFY